MSDTEAAKKYFSTVEDTSDDEVSFTLEDVAFGDLDDGDGDYPHDNDDEVPGDGDGLYEEDVEDGVFPESSPDDPPDIQRHDRKYHHGHYTGKGECKYREDRAAAIASLKEGETEQEIVDRLTPEDVEGEEIDKADSEISGEERKDGPTDEYPRSLSTNSSAVRSRNAYAGMSNAEKNLVLRISAVRGRLRRLDKAWPPDDDAINEAKEELKDLREQRKKLRISLGKGVQGEFPSRDSVLLGNKAFRLKKRWRKIIGQQCSMLEGGKTMFDLFGDDSRRFSELIELRKKTHQELKDQLKRDAEDLDRRTERGETIRATYYMNREPVTVQWSHGRWVTIGISSKARHIMRERSKKSAAKLLAERGAEQMAKAHREYNTLWNTRRHLSDLGIDQGRGMYLMDQFRQETRDYQKFPWRSFRKWLEAKGEIGDGVSAQV